MKTIVYREVPEGEEHNYYWMHLICSNCGESGSYAIRKGNKAMFAECPECGCDTLEQPDRNN